MCTGCRQVHDVEKIVHLINLMDHVICLLMFTTLINNAEGNTLVAKSPELKPSEYTERNVIMRSKDMHIL